MKKEQRKKLEEMISKGKLHFIAKYGILYFGLPMAIFMHILTEGFVYPDAWTINPYFYVWGSAGIIYGFWMIVVLFLVILGVIVLG